MSMYEQISVMPIYESGLVMFNIICGAVILREDKVYTKLELLGIVISAGICVMGCFMLAGIKTDIKDGKHVEISAVGNNNTEPLLS